MKNLKVLRSLVLIFALATVIPMVPMAHAQTNTLSISPTSQGLSPIGSTVTYQVTVSNFDTFTAYDVSVQVDPTVLDPQSITLGNVFASPLELTNCVDGIGTGCTINDAPGIAHDAAFELGSEPTAPVNGVLFTITYLVTGCPSTPVNINSNEFSYLGTDLNVSSVQNGFFGATGPVFCLNANPPTLTIQQGSSGTSQLVFSAFNNFSDIVTLSSSISPSLSTGPTLSFNNLVFVPTTGATTPLTISTSTTTTSTLYSITVTGMGFKTGVTQTTTISLLITPLGQPAFAKGFHWTHHVDIAKAPTETWTGTVSNPTATGKYVLVTLRGASGGNVFITQTPLTFIAAGSSTTITLTHTFTPSDVGLKFSFVATMVFSDTPSPLLFTSTSTQSGSVAVV